MEIDYAEIGRNIREHRRRCGMKQKELAELINVSDSTSATSRTATPS